MKLFAYLLFAAAASAQVSSVGSDLPFTLTWADHRPIGQLILGTTATGWSTNPRGWLLDPSINVFTSTGVAALKTRILQWADNSVRILKQMNAQGMITWDIEGEQYPQPTTYIGDPRIFDTLAPEMAGIADAYFKRFTDAGLRVGVCIRPQSLVLRSGYARQVTQTDPTALLNAKIAYARQRWGATLFYIDSTVDQNGIPIDATIIQRVQVANPDVLLIPENQTLGYYAVSAPYDELRQNVPETPAQVRAAYPQAFSVIYTADGDFDRYHDALVEGVSHGDILLFRGWFDDPGNAKVAAIEQEAGQIQAPPPPPPPPPPSQPDYIQLQSVQGHQFCFATTLAAIPCP